MEKDDDIKGQGYSYDFGARIYDSRLGRWLSMDKIRKPYISHFNFSANNPINYTDPDGNDEIHFYYTTQQAFNSEGEIITTISISVTIIEDGKEELAFFMGQNIKGAKEVQFFPFIKGTRISNNHSFYAAANNLIMSKERYFFGMFKSNIDDYGYLGILLTGNSSVLEHYKGTKWYKYLNGAVKQEKSRALGEKARIGTEIVVGIIDGYYLLRSIGKFTLKKAFKAKTRSFGTMFTSANLVKSTNSSIIKSIAGSAKKHFKEIVKNSGGKMKDVATQSNGVKTFKGKDGVTSTLRKGSDGNWTISQSAKDAKGFKIQKKIRFTKE